MTVKIGKTPLLCRYALQPDEYGEDEEGSGAHNQLQVVASDDFDGVDVGVEGDGLRQLVDLEHVNYHIIQLDEAQLSEVVPCWSLFRLRDVICS